MYILFGLATAHTLEMCASEWISESNNQCNFFCIVVVVVLVCGKVWNMMEKKTYFAVYILTYHLHDAVGNGTRNPLSYDPCVSATFAAHQSIFSSSLLLHINRFHVGREPYDGKSALILVWSGSVYILCFFFVFFFNIFWPSRFPSLCLVVLFKVKGWLFRKCSRTQPIQASHVLNTPQDVSFRCRWMWTTQPKWYWNIPKAFIFSFPSHSRIYIFLHAFLFYLTTRCIRRCDVWYWQTKNLNWYWSSDREREREKGSRGIANREECWLLKASKIKMAKKNVGKQRKWIWRDEWRIDLDFDSIRYNPKHKYTHPKLKWINWTNVAFNTQTHEMKNLNTLTYRICNFLVFVKILAAAASDSPLLMACGERKNPNRFTLEFRFASLPIRMYRIKMETVFEEILGTKTDSILCRPRPLPAHFCETPKKQHEQQRQREWARERKSEEWGKRTS